LKSKPKDWRNDSSFLLFVGATSFVLAITNHIISGSEHGKQLGEFFIANFGTFYHALFPEWFSLGNPEWMAEIIQVTLNMVFIMIGIGASIYYWHTRDD
jgi:hypothetical protein